MLVSALLYVVPLPLGFLTNGAYGRVILLVAMSHGLTLYGKHGMPQFNSDYLRKIASSPDSEFFALFSCGVMFICRPNVLVLFILTCTEAWWFAFELKTVSPSMYTTLSAFASPVCKLIYGVDGHRELGQGPIVDNKAFAEVLLGVFLLVELLLPTRNVFATLGYWQYLRLMYMLSPRTTRLCALSASHGVFWYCRLMH